MKLSILLDGYMRFDYKKLNISLLSTVKLRKNENNRKVKFQL